MQTKYTPITNYNEYTFDELENNCVYEVVSGDYAGTIFRHFRHKDNVWADNQILFGNIIYSPVSTFHVFMIHSPYLFDAYSTTYRKLEHGKIEMTW